MVVCASDIEIETDTSPIFALVWYSRIGDAEDVEFLTWKSAIFSKHSTKEAILND